MFAKVSAMSRANLQNVTGRVIGSNSHAESPSTLISASAFDISSESASEESPLIFMNDLASPVHSALFAKL